MTARILNVVGLVLNMGGVVILFIYGFPQPSFEKSDGKEGQFMMHPFGETATKALAAKDAAKQLKENQYNLRAKAALGMITAGFVCQSVATCL